MTTFTPGEKVWVFLPDEWRIVEGKFSHESYGSTRVVCGFCSTYGSSLRVHPTRQLALAQAREFRDSEVDRLLALTFEEVEK